MKVRVGRGGKLESEREVSERTREEKMGERGRVRMKTRGGMRAWVDLRKRAEG